MKKLHNVEFEERFRLLREEFEKEGLMEARFVIHFSLSHFPRLHCLLSSVTLSTIPY